MFALLLPFLCLLDVATAASANLAFTLARSFVIVPPLSPALSGRRAISPESEPHVFISRVPSLTKRSELSHQLTTRVEDATISKVIDHDEFQSRWRAAASHHQSMLVETQDVNILMPNLTDRETLLNLARATWDAYYPMPTSNEEWYTLPGLIWKEPFGWRLGEDGLKGHIFLSEDGSQGLIDIKGTVTMLQEWSQFPDPTQSEGRDKVNDNLLFSCCCAQGSIFSKPCGCYAGGNTCNSECLTKSLLRDNSYYTSGKLIVDSTFRLYPNTSFWLVGHSLGGSIASLLGQTYSLPTVTFEAPGDRLASIRLGLYPSSLTQSKNTNLITHVYNDADIIALGECNHGKCSRLGYMMESKCRVGRSIVFNMPGEQSGWWKKLPKWTWNMTRPFTSHLLESVLHLLEEESLVVPPVLEQKECNDCSNWVYGDYEPLPLPHSWWRRVSDWIPGAWNTVRVWSVWFWDIVLHIWVRTALLRI